MNENKNGFILKKKRNNSCKEKSHFNFSNSRDRSREKFHVTMVANFWITKIGSLCNSKKVTGLDWQKNNFARASCFFVHFLAVVARLRHETS